MLNVSTLLLSAAREELAREIKPKTGKPYRLAHAETSKAAKNKTYWGYLSALGPSLRRLGLLAALVNYRDEGNSDEATRPVYELLYRLLISKNAGLLRDAERNDLKGHKDLIAYLLTLSSDQRQLLQPRLERAILAAKLALRSFPMPSANPQINHSEPEEE